LFLAVVIMVVCLGNVIAFDKDVGLGSKAFALTTVNIFALSLLAFWFGGYAQRPEQKAKLLIIGHAALMLSGRDWLGRLGISRAKSRRLRLPCSRPWPLK